MNIHRLKGLIIGVDCRGDITAFWILREMLSVVHKIEGLSMPYYCGENLIFENRNVIFQSIQNALEMSNQFPFASKRILYSLINEHEETFGKHAFGPSFHVFFGNMIGCTKVKSLETIVKSHRF
jgi:hypothetical protein